MYGTFSRRPKVSNVNSVATTPTNSSVSDNDNDELDYSSNSSPPASPKNKKPINNNRRTAWSMEQKRKGKGKGEGMEWNRERDRKLIQKRFSHFAKQNLDALLAEYEKNPAGMRNYLKLDNASGKCVIL